LRESPTPPALPEPSPQTDGPEFWCVMETGADGIRRVCWEMLLNAAALCAPLHGSVSAVLAAPRVNDVFLNELATCGADRLYLLDTRQPGALGQALCEKIPELKPAA